MNRFIVAVISQRSKPGLWLILATCLYYAISQKTTLNSCPLLPRMLSDFQNTFAGRNTGKFATNWYLNIPPHLKYVATLSCEISIFKKSQCSRTRSFNGPFSGTTQLSRYQKGKSNLDFTEARDSEWQWHQLGHMQVCTSLQTDNHARTPPLSFLQAGCPSCHPSNSVKTLKAQEVIKANCDVRLSHSKKLFLKYLSVKIFII